MKNFILCIILSITTLGQTQNLITNGSFSSGTNNWVGTNFSVVSGEAYIPSSNSGGNPWDTQLVQGGMTFTAGYNYTLTFKARAASNRNITVAIQNVGIWSDQFRQTYSLTTTMQTFTTSFTAPFTNSNVQIGFLMAALGSTSAVYYDDVVIQLAQSSNATLSDLRVNGVTISGFIPSTTHYVYSVTDLESLPVISATKASLDANDPIITQAPDLYEDATVQITAQDGTVLTYTVRFGTTIAQGLQNFENPASYSSLTGDNGTSASIQSSPGGVIGNSLRLISSSSGQSWQAGYFNQVSNFVTLSPLSNIVRVQVYASQSFHLRLKLETGATPVERTATYSGTALNTWQTLIFNFGSVTATFQKIVFFLNSNSAGNDFLQQQNFTAFIDNIELLTIQTDRLTYTYQNSVWSPENPVGLSTSLDNISILDGIANLSTNLVANDFQISSGATLNVVSQGVLNVARNINNDGNLVFKSDATGSGVFDQFTGTITGSGTVQVERYIPARRAFRFVTSSVTTSGSIRANWQENGGSAAGLGTHITGTGSATDGFDVTATNNPSMFGFNHNTGQWSAVTNTNINTLIAGTPYRLMVRGDRTTDLTTNTPNLSITKLRATGALHTGNFTPSLNQAPEGFSFIGNPYQAPLDMQAVLTASTNINSDQLYYWDPTLNERGAYVARTLSNNTNVPLSNFTEILQPGQAVFVKNTSNGNPTMTIEETHKAVNQGVAGVFRTSNTLSNVGMIRVNLQANVQNAWQTIEGTLAIFNDDYSWAVTQEDATKMGNLDEEVSFMLEGTALAIAFQNQASVTSVLPIQINKMRHTDYQWTFDLNNYNGLTPMLWDEQTQTMTAITNTTVVPFSTTATATDRFKIVFQEIMHMDDFSFNVTLYPNPGKSNQSFYLSGVTEAKVSMQSLLGQEIPVTTRQNGQTMEVKPETVLSTGVYFVSVTQAGKTAQVKWIVE